MKIACKETTFYLNSQIFCAKNALFCTLHLCLCRLFCRFLHKNSFFVAEYFFLFREVEGYFSRFFVFSACALKGIRSIWLPILYIRCRVSFNCRPTRLSRPTPLLSPNNPLASTLQKLSDEAEKAKGWHAER